MDDDGFENARPPLRVPTPPSPEDQIRIAATRAYDQQETLRRENAARAFLQGSEVFWKAVAAHHLDDETKKLILNAAAKDMAEQKTPGTVEAKDIIRLANDAVSKGLEQERLEREAARKLEQAQQQERHRDELLRLQLEPHQRRYYAELRETHRTVGEEMEAKRSAQVERPHQDIQSEQTEPRHHGRYAELAEAHDRAEVEIRQRDETTACQTVETERANRGEITRDAGRAEVKGEQSESRREMDDRAQARQARMRAFGREIEEAFHNELEQEGGRERGS